MTFGTASEGQWASTLSPMEVIATITSYAAITRALCLVAIFWREAERADETGKGRQ